MKILTKKQSKIFSYIQKKIHAVGYAPPYQEIAEHFGLRSKATIAQHLATLEAKGYLKLPGGRAGTIQPMAAASNSTQAVTLPLVGVIAAGQPIEALEGDDTLAVPANLATDPANTYILKVKGQSMSDEGILDGDYVIVQRNPSPRNGDVVVALLDNAYATLKKFYRETNRIRLQPANPAMQPIYAKDPLIQGVVRGVIRKFATS